MTLDAPERIHTRPEDERVLKHSQKEKNSSRKRRSMNLSPFIESNDISKYHNDPNRKVVPQLFSLEQKISKFSLSERTPERLRTGNFPSTAHSPIFGFLTVCKN